jgi:hypothetical protein
MLRRIVIVSLATAVIGPVFTAAPASAVVLFTCSAYSGNITILPGLSATLHGQTVSGTGGIGGCDNGQTATMKIGTAGGSGFHAVQTYASRPLGCPDALGGPYPAYPDQTPILIGVDDPSFSVDWASGPDSTGIPKVKSTGPETAITVSVVFVITAGQYVSTVAGQKTKIKTMLAMTPTDSYNCANDSDPITAVSLTDDGGVLVNRK